MSFQIQIHPDALPYVPTPGALRTLSRRFDLPLATVRLLPRATFADRITRSPLPAYAFRAVTRDGVSTLLVDPTETRDSVAFLVAHELTHQLVDTDPALEDRLADMRPDLEPHSDVFHRTDPEERLCDDVAASLFGVRLDRDWWRRRVVALSARRP